MSRSVGRAVKLVMICEGLELVEREGELFKIDIESMHKLRD